MLWYQLIGWTSSIAETVVGGPNKMSKETYFSRPIPKRAVPEQKVSVGVIMMSQFIILVSKLFT